MGSFIEDTVADLFARLEKSRIRYAVLRNYEQLPRLRCEPGDGPNTDIDLVVAAEDVPALRQIAGIVAAENGWDALTECDHWGRSGVAAHRVEVFRFYRARPLGFLQIDVFHAWLVWGVPLFTEQDLLAGCARRSFFTQINGSVEHICAALKLHGLAGPPRNQAKVARYRGRLARLCPADWEELRRATRSKLSPRGVDALDALRARDLAGFRRMIWRAKIDFLFRAALRRPLFVSRAVGARIREHVLRYRISPCGFVLRVHAPEQAHRARLREVLECLVRENCIDEWTSRFSPHERRVMEQGGLVIEWTAQTEADIDVTAAPGLEDLTTELLSFLQYRHPPLWARAAAGERLQADAVVPRR